MERLAKRRLLVAAERVRRAQAPRPRRLSAALPPCPAARRAAPIGGRLSPLRRSRQRSRPARLPLARHEGDALRRVRATEARHSLLHAGAQIAPLGDRAAFRRHARRRKQDHDLALAAAAELVVPHLVAAVEAKALAALAERQGHVRLVITAQRIVLA